MKRKTVLVVHRGYPLGVEAGDKVRTLNMVNSLQNLGYRVILLGFFTKGLSQLRKEKASLPVGLKSFLLYSLPNRMHLEKIAELIRAIETFIICKLYSVDIIQAELSASATCARFVPDIPLITDFHSDIVPEVEMDGYPKNVVLHAVSENKFALKHSNAVIAVSENLLHNLSVYGKVNDKYSILPCNFESTPFRNLTVDLRTQMRKEYGLENRIVLCYSGAFRVWQCIKETLEVVIRLRELNPAYFLCIYTNDDVTPYQGLLERLSGNYMVKGLKRTEVPAYLSMTDAGFVLRADSLVNINSSPTKTSEYLAAGMMVVATRFSGDAPLQIKESGCGIVFSDLDLSDYDIQRLNTVLINYVEDYKVMSTKAKSYVFSNRVWSSNEHKLRTLYNDMGLMINRSTDMYD